MKLGFHIILGSFFARSICLWAAFSTEAPFSPNNDWEPNVAADSAPGSQWVYMVAAEQTSKSVRKIVLRASQDYGKTLNPLVQVCGKACSGDQADPTVQVSNTGAVYVCWLATPNPGPVVSRSFDHGQTFTHPVPAWPAKSSWTDKPWMTISPDGSEVYVSWYGKKGQYFSASLDGGNSFNTAALLPENALYWFPEGGAVSPVTGTIIFSASGENPTGTGPVVLSIQRSSDHGSSWSRQRLSTSAEGPICQTNCHDDEFQASTTLAVDSAGTFLFAYSLTATSNMAKSIYVRTSSDDGLTWSDPVAIYTAPQNTPVGDGGFPTVAAGPQAGQFGVVWQDNRNGPSAWNTYFRSTQDGGKTWSTETRLSNLGPDLQYPYKSAQGYQFPYGDYTGLTANSAGTYFALWGEGEGRETVGNQWYSSGN